MGAPKNDCDYGHSQLTAWCCHQTNGGEHQKLDLLQTFGGALKMKHLGLS